MITAALTSIIRAWEAHVRAQVGHFEARFGMKSALVSYVATRKRFGGPAGAWEESQRGLGGGVLGAPGGPRTALWKSKFNHFRFPRGVLRENRFWKGFGLENQWFWHDFWMEFGEHFARQQTRCGV